MNEPSFPRTAAEGELDATQSATVADGEGECDLYDASLASGFSQAYGRVYEWVVDATSEAIERLADRLK